MADFDEFQLQETLSQQFARRDRFRNKRMGQRDVLPNAIKLRLQEFYDSKNRALIIPAYIASFTYGTKVSGLIKELNVPILSGGSSSGAIASYYTDSTTFTNLDTSEFKLDPDDFKNSTIKLELVFRAGASGSTDRTLEAHIYDVTDGAVVANSTITSNTKQASSGPGSYPTVRSNDFKSNLTSGSRDYILRYKTQSAGDFVDIYFARLIIRY